ncbi:MAG: hypothetical protein MJZ16_00480 [Bacteroidales bacterium]|nr:hypothetical protein [Bacteroidales bacterium]
MKILKYLTLIMVGAAFATSCHNSYVAETIRLDSLAPDESQHRGIYYWKTAFSLTDKDSAFITDHKIDRMYIRMFDVDSKYNNITMSTEVVPVGTIRFDSEVPSFVRAIPTVYITLNALRQYESNESELAQLIVDRILAMFNGNHIGQVSEIQYDCDWTEKTKPSFEKLCQATKELIHPYGIILSGTIRLHQIGEKSYPFDRGVMMMYNTGDFRKYETRNSILDYDDVKAYLGNRSRVKSFLSARENTCSQVDFAYPAFSWGVLFSDHESFLGLVKDESPVSRIVIGRRPRELCPGDGEYYDINDGSTFGEEVRWSRTIVRWETAEMTQIRKVKDMVRNTIAAEGIHSNIIYHLDLDNLSNYTFDEIEEMFN